MLGKSFKVKAIWISQVSVKDAEREEMELSYLKLVRLWLLIPKFPKVFEK